MRPIAVLNEPQRVEVACDSHGLPTRIRLRKRWRVVARVVDVWRLDDEWWSGVAITRLYVRVLIDEGRPLTLRSRRLQPRA